MVAAPLVRASVHSMDFTERRQLDPYDDKTRGSSMRLSVNAHRDSSPANEYVMPRLNEPITRLLVDIDVGGTFTDAIVSSDGLVRFFKVDTTPHDLSKSLQDVFNIAVRSLKVADLRAFLEQTQVVRLSTSLSMNSLIERRVPICGLMVEKGWRRRYLDQTYSPSSPFPLVTEDLVVELDLPYGKADHSGVILAEDEVRGKVRILLDRGAQIILVSWGGHESCAEAEYKLKSIVLKYYPGHFLGSVPVLMTSQMSNSTDYLERTNTAVLNACCHGSMAKQFYQIEEYLRQNGYANSLLVVHSSGGGANVAKSKAIQTLNSGAAAGIFRVARFAGNHGEQDLAYVDVGGTTTEIGFLKGGEIEYFPSDAAGGLAVDLLTPLASTVGTGGGSIARLDGDGRLQLGPKSTGAFPGPACYNLGGESPTLTDAFLILGYLDEDYFLGGQKIVSKEMAERVFREKLAGPMGISCEEAALAVMNRAIETIGHAIMKLCESTGSRLDVRSLVAVGGGGGCMGAELARFLNLDQCYVFRQNAVFGAYGTSGMDITHVYERRLDLPRFGDISYFPENSRKLNAAVAAAQREACYDMQSEGFDPSEINFVLQLEISAPGIRLPCRVTMPTPFIWPDRDGPRLIELIQSRFGEADAESETSCRVIRYFLRALAPVPHPKRAAPGSQGSLADARKGSRGVYAASSSTLEFDVFEWDMLTVPRIITGPAIIESSDTTVIVPLGGSLDLDEDYNGVIRTGIGT